MSSRNVLVLVLEEGFEAQLRRAVAGRPDAVQRLHVVAPTRVGRLDWLATAEDAARREAGRRARHTEWSLDDPRLVDSEVGESDAVLAVEDALRVFPADEILVVADSSTDEGLDWSLRRFGLPVDRVPACPPGRRPGGWGHSSPAVLFAGVNVFLAALGALVAVIIVLALWLR